MTKLTFYGGVNEIGGNKILLQDKKTRGLLDFGQSFTFGEDYFTGYLSARNVNGLGDYFAFNLLPRIEGLYSKEMLAYCDLPHCEPKIDAMFVSHAHFDHINHLKFLDPEIPVYTGYGTKLFMECMEETGFACDYGTHTFNSFRTRDKIKIGSLTVEPVHVDHSIPAAYGFIIETSQGNIVYTGDLRRHGTRSDLTEDFIEKAKAADPVALITEGTRMATSEKRQNIGEPDVKKHAQEVILNTDKIVFVSHYSRDIDRFNSFYKASKKANRKLVITPKTAHLLTKLSDDKHLTVPNPVKDKNILVYYKRKKSGNHDDKDYFLWEREFMNNMTTFDYVKSHQKELVMDLDFYQFTELIDIKPEAGSNF
jgi:ribonuclease J